MPQGRPSSSAAAERIAEGIDERLSTSLTSQAELAAEAARSSAAQRFEQLAAQRLAELQTRTESAREEIDQHVEATLTKKARHHELELAREEREEGIKAAEARLELRSRQLLEEARGEVEQLRSGEVAALRSEIAAMRAEAGERAAEVQQRLDEVFAGAQSSMAELAETTRAAITGSAESAGSGVEERARAVEAEIGLAVSNAREQLAAIATETKLEAERAVRSQERELATRMRTDLGAMMIEARAELVALRDELNQSGGDVRIAASAAEERVAQIAELAETTLSTKAQSAAAQAIRDLTATARDLSLRIEAQAGVGRRRRAARRGSRGSARRRSATARVRRAHTHGTAPSARGSGPLGRDDAAVVRSAVRFTRSGESESGITPGPFPEPLTSFAGEQDARRHRVQRMERHRCLRTWCCRCRHEARP